MRLSVLCGDKELRVECPDGTDLRWVTPPESSGRLDFFSGDHCIGSIDDVVHWHMDEMFISSARNVSSIIDVNFSATQLEQVIEELYKKLMENAGRLNATP